MFGHKNDNLYLIAGLGNPTEKYAGTRHNMGFDTIDCLARKLGVSVKKKEKKALTGTASFGGVKLLLVKPQTYMNLSGESIRPLMDYYRIPRERLLVISDDVNLPAGSLRLRAGGSAGGHNGLKSVIAHLGTEEFARLRIGVGQSDHADMIGHVLGHIPPAERRAVDEAIELAAEAALVFAGSGIAEAMNRYNGIRRKEEDGGTV